MLMQFRWFSDVALGFISVFNNREKAIIAWGIVLLVCLLCIKDIRRIIGESFFSLLKNLFLGKVGVALSTVTLYVVLIVFLVYNIRLWDISMLKDTIVWFLGTAFIRFINVNNVTKEDNYFKNVILDNLRLVVVLEFIINLYVFNLWGELVLIPITFLLTAMIAVPVTEKKDLLAKKLINVILSIIVVFVIVFSFYRMVSDFSNFATVQNLKNFLLFPYLTALYLPFVYLLALYGTYDSTFNRIDFLLKENKELARFTKWKIFWQCLFNLKKLSMFSKMYTVRFMSIKNNSDVTNLIREFKTKYKK
jgi:hypothetical protein